MATINVRVDDKLKSDAEKVLASIGLNISSAISIYFAQIIQQRAIPFLLLAKGSTFGADNYYNESWYQSAEAKELMSRANSKHFEGHSLIKVK